MKFYMGFIAFLGINCLAQSSFMVYVQDLNGDPISNISITPSPGSADAPTGNDGRARLFIEQVAKVGDLILLRVDNYSKWELQKPQLLVRYPGREKTVKVTLVRKGKPWWTQRDKGKSLGIGDVDWSHNSSFGADVQESESVKHYPVSFTRSSSRSSKEHDFSIEFDITNFSTHDLRVVSIEVEVLGVKPIGNIISLVPYAGLGEKRKYYCSIRGKVDKYECQFSKPGKYIKLTSREMEVIRIQISTPDEGIYDLAAHVRYSVAGKTETIRTLPKRGVWFVGSRR